MSKINFKKPSSDSGGMLRVLLVDKILKESAKIDILDSMLHEAANREPDAKTAKSRTKIVSNWTSKISASRVTFKTITEFLDKVYRVISIEFTIRVKWSNDYETVHTMKGKFDRKEENRKEEQKDGKSK